MELGAPFGLRPSQRTALKTSAISPESKRATSSAGMGFWHSDSGLNQKFDPGSIGNMSLAMAPKQVSGSLTIAARREQVLRQYDAAPENIERDKFQERIAKLSGGHRHHHGRGCHAGRAETAHAADRGLDQCDPGRDRGGIVPGGGVALLKSAPALDPLIAELSGSRRQGAELLQRALSRPLYYIAANCGLDGEREVAKAASGSNGHGLDARTGGLVDMMAAGIVDPVKVSYSAVRNAASVAGLILTTQTLIAKKPDGFDPTSGPALGGGRSCFEARRTDDEGESGMTSRQTIRVEAHNDACERDLRADGVRLLLRRHIGGCCRSAKLRQPP